MRLLLRRRIRSFFALQAIILFILALRTLLSAPHSTSPIHRYGFLLTYALLSMVFAKAWRTTYRPKAALNPWAITASAVSIVAGFYFLWAYQPSFMYATPGLIAIAVGIGGILIYSTGGSLAPPQTASN
jgi:uncharacterized protein involved in response to NO